MNINSVSFLLNDRDQEPIRSAFTCPPMRRETSAKTEACAEIFAQLSNPLPSAVIPGKRSSYNYYTPEEDCLLHAAVKEHQKNGEPDWIKIAKVSFGGKGTRSEKSLRQRWYTLYPNKRKTLPSKGKNKFPKLTLAELDKLKNNVNNFRDNSGVVNWDMLRANLFECKYAIGVLKKNWKDYIEPDLR